MSYCNSVLICYDVSTSQSVREDQVKSNWNATETKALKMLSKMKSDLAKLSELMHYEQLDHVYIDSAINEMTKAFDVLECGHVLEGRIEYYPNTLK